jgi:hypothetical protein
MLRIILIVILIFLLLIVLDDLLLHFIDFQHFHFINHFQQQALLIILLISLLILFTPYFRFPRDSQINRHNLPPLQIIPLVNLLIIQLFKIIIMIIFLKYFWQTILFMITQVICYLIIIHFLMIFILTSFTIEIFR